MPRYPSATDATDVGVDERALRELTTQSDDQHADAMRAGREHLDDYVDAAADARRRRSRTAVVGGLAGAGVLVAAASASASSTDVQALQTAASIENLAVATYTKALTLPFIGGSSANAVVKAFATKTMAQHADHAKAFNAAAVRLGGKAQNNPDPKYAPVVAAAVPGLTTPAAVVALAITLENVAAETYVKDTSLVSTGELRQLFTSVAGVEAQHVAILLAVQALLKGNDAAAITLPPPLAQLPAAAGSVGFPNAFYPTSKASPVTEGAVQ